MSCEFINKKTNIKCNYTAVNGNVYCSKHKRYAYGKKNKPTDQLNIKETSRITVDDNIQIQKQDEKINGIDMSNILNNNDESIISAQNNKFDEQIKPEEIKETKMFNGEHYDESVECDVDDDDKPLDGEPLHDPDTVGEMIYPFIEASAAVLEHVSKITKDQTNVYFDGLVVDTQKKKETYKHLIKMSYKEDPGLIDEYVTPGRALLAHMAVSMGTTIKRNDDPLALTY